MKRVFVLVAVATGLVVTAGVAEAATPYYWTKSLAEQRVSKKNAGVITACVPMSAPYRQGGLNYYSKFTCAIAFPSGDRYGFTVVPRNSTGYSELDTTKLASGPSTPSVASPVVPVSPGITHWIENVDSTNDIVKLEDGTVWKITDISAYKLVLWLPVDRVSIQAGQFGGYTLVNLRRGEALNAQLIGSA
jgi:hypothetical protein